MIVVGVSMMRDEQDVCERVVRHMWSQGVDHVLVGNHGSTDDTRRCLLDAGANVVDLLEPGYYQSRFMSGLARQAAGEYGADWVVPFDADEFWYATEPGLTVGDVLRASPHAVEMATSFEQFGEFRGPAKRLAKVAFRYQQGVKIAQGNHDVVGVAGSRGQGSLAIRELQYRSFDHLCRKVRNGKAAYDATDLHPMEGAHWREMGSWDDDHLRSWWENHRSELSVHDPLPWELR